MRERKKEINEDNRESTNRDAEKDREGMGEKDVIERRRRVIQRGK